MKSRGVCMLMMVVLVLVHQGVHQPCQHKYMEKCRLIPRQWEQTNIAHIDATTNKPIKPTRPKAWCVKNLNEIPQQVEWLIDSGASKHMTCHREIPQDYQEFPKPQSVKLGDGRVV